VTQEQGGININIRQMRHADLEQVHHIDSLSFTLPWPKKSFAFELDHNPCSRSWIAETVPSSIESQVIGAIVLWLVADEGHIGTIAVHPDFRRRGIASMLLTHTLESIQREGANSVYLEVRRNNIGAQVLYKKFGFHLTDIRAGYYANDGEDALVLRLDEIQSKVIKNLGGSTNKKIQSGYII
jgi:ribosomal-protein-alanine N-acetyltransferase